MISVICRIVTSTQDAVLCTKKRKSGKVEYWLPKSQIYISEPLTDRGMSKRNHIINMPQWLYDKTFGEYRKHNPIARVYKGMNTNKM